MSDPYAASAIDIELKFFPLAFLLYLFKPRVEIDGAPPLTVSWGVARYPVAPGRHQVRAYLPYLFFTHMGDAVTTIDVAPGQVVRATWSAPWLAFLAGKWQVAPAAMGGAAPGAAAFAGAVPQAMPGGAPPAYAASVPAAVAAATAPAAAWHPDPTGRHQMRYWDGAAWTAHVSDNGVTASDPLG